MGISTQSPSCKWTPSNSSRQVDIPSSPIMVWFIDLTHSILYHNPNPHKWKSACPLPPNQRRRTRSSTKQTYSRGYVENSEPPDTSSTTITKMFRWLSFSTNKTKFPRLGNSHIECRVMAWSWTGGWWPSSSYQPVKCRNRGLSCHLTHHPVCLWT